MQSHRKFGVSAGKFGACLAAALLSCTSEDAAKPAENTGGAGGSGGAASYERAPFPAEEWTVRTPEEMGMDRQLLEQACAYALEFDGDADGVPDTFTQGVVIVRGNALVHECYASQGQYGTTAGGEPIPNRDRQASDLATSWSGAKSFTSTLIGIAIDEGLIEGVNVPMSTFFPEWAEDERREIRLQDVLWMQSGLRFREEYIDVNAEIVQLFNSSDANAFARALPAPRGATGITRAAIRSSSVPCFSSSRGRRPKSTLGKRSFSPSACARLVGGRTARGRRRPIAASTPPSETSPASGCWL
jgi:hypothetical protein